MQLLSLEIKQKSSKSFCLACWYRPRMPSVDENAFENLIDTLGILDSECKKIFFVCDIKCHFTNKNANEKSSSCFILNIKWSN